MPLIYQIIQSPTSKLAVWKIEESKEELLDALGHSVLNFNQLNNMHANRQLEWLASRTLICQLISGCRIENIQNDSFGRPFLSHTNTNISISHTKGYVAVFNSEQIVGIDIQHISPKIKSIAHKYLDLESLHSLDPSNNLEALHLLWGAKESLYKCYGRKRLDFKTHIKVPTMGMDIADDCWRYPFSTTGQISKGLYQKDFKVEAIKLDSVMLVYAKSKL